MRVIPIVDATTSDAVVGRHSIWLPKLAVKIPFQWSGRVTKYGHVEASYDPAEVIPNELAILRALAVERMAPPIGELVFVETLISEHPGGWHADPCGAWGYEMADAAKLPPGRFSVEAMKKLPIEGSAGAWNDISVPGRDNVCNGYLIDVARSRFDSLRWTGALEPLPKPPLDVAELRADVHRLCQFPPGQRSEAYQDFWLDGTLERGERRIVERAALLGFTPQPGETVLEIGCQSGGFLQLAHVATEGEGTFLGVEVVPDYVHLARALARSCRMNICFRQMNAAAEREALLAWIRQRCPRGVDHLLLLSMEKHLDIWPLLDAIGARWTYVETNAVAADSGVGAPPAGPMKLWDKVHARGGRYVGDSRDRNLRRLYQIPGRPC